MKNKINITLISILVLFSLIFIKNRYGELISEATFVLTNNKTLQIQPKKFNETIDRKNKEIKNLKLENIRIIKETYPLLETINEFVFHKSIKMIDNKFELINYTNPILKHLGPRAYIKKYKNNIYLLTGTGLLLTGDLLKEIDNKVIFKKIKSNFSLISDKKYIKDEKNIITDLLIHKDIFYFVYRNKIKEKCYEISVLNGTLKEDSIFLSELFSTNECQPIEAGAEGGKLTAYKDNKLLLTIGDHGSYEKQYNTNPQKLDNLLGKIISIDLKEKKYEIISIGHRNQQGLKYQKDLDVIFSSEHGPRGGDEVNININPSSTGIKNYGWGISSYGEHYSPNKKLLEISPLYKSHTKYGFNEPVKNFTPSIGISQIALSNLTKEKKITLYVSALGYDIEEGDMSIHRLVFDRNLEIINKDIIKINERIRDIFIDSAQDNEIFLFLESSGSIGKLKL